MATQTKTMSSSAPKRPPMTPGLPVIGNMLDFMKVGGALPVHAFQDSVQRYGDVVCLTIGRRRLYVVGHPELVHEILVKRVQEFHKPTVSHDPPNGLARYLGYGILTADHEEWKPQRKLIQPLMHTKHITSYADTMAQMAQKLMERWDADTAGVREIDLDMTQVTMWVIAETMFGTDATHTAEIEDVVRRAQALTIAETAQPLPDWLSRKRLRDAAHVNDVLTQLVKRIISVREASGEQERGDLLTLLLETRDEDGNPMPERWIRDNILTLFLAGHETTAHTLTWVLYYLDQNPHVAAKLHEEVDRVLAGRAPTLADVPNLKYTEMVIKESMRVEPTVATLPRFVLDEVELGGYHIPRRSMIFLPIYVLHHDPRWWDQPDRFDPERFSPENEPNIPKYAYLPFGGGPRVCIGNHFSMMETQILLASFVSRYTFSTVPGQKIHPLRMITTAPKFDLRMRVERR